MATLETGGAKASETSQPRPLYRDSGKPIDDRVSDLLSRIDEAIPIAVGECGSTEVGGQSDFRGTGGHTLESHFGRLHVY